MTPDETPESDRRTVFITLNKHWTHEEMMDLQSTLAEELPDSIGVVLVPDGVDFLTDEQVSSYVGELTAALENTQA